MDRDNRVGIENPESGEGHRHSGKHATFFRQEAGGAPQGGSNRRQGGRILGGAVFSEGRFD
jgi:hypothetical protein